MKYTVGASLFALITTVLVFFALIYPAWFQQTYRESPEEVFQGFGLWAYHASAELNTPFYSSETTLSYQDLCAIKTDFPNYMLGAGSQYQDALCGGGITAVQIITCAALFLTLVVLVSSVVAVFKVDAGQAERIVSMATLVGSLMLSLSLIIWGWVVQSDLYDINPINASYQTCESTSQDWSCWFYGTSFWVALGAILGLSITGYLSSAGRSEKLRRYRKQYQHDMDAAVHASIADASRMSSFPQPTQGQMQPQQPSQHQQQHPIYTIMETPRLVNGEQSKAAPQQKTMEAIPVPAPVPMPTSQVPIHVPIRASPPQPTLPASYGNTRVASSMASYSTREGSSAPMPMPPMSAASASSTGGAPAAQQSAAFIPNPQIAGSNNGAMV